MFWTFVFAAFVATSCALELPGVPAEFSAPDAVLSAISDDVARKFEQEYMAFLKTGVESPALRQISAQLARMHSKKELFTRETHELSPADSFFACTTCRATVNVLARMFRDEDGALNGEHNDELAKSIMLDVCARLEMQTEEVCAGLFDANWPTAEFIIHNSVSDSRTFCSLFMEYGFCNVKQDEYSWSLAIDASGPAVSGPKADAPVKSDADLRILHLTDIHYDPLYTPGALAECDEPLCCQRHKDLVEGTSRAAGFWGDFRECDTPLHTVHSALAHIQRTHPQIDFVYQTGDVVDHMVWATSKDKNADVLSDIHAKLEEAFPGVRIYPSIGNHEPHPLNVFSPADAPEEVSTRWMYEHLYDIWSKWLPVATRETILAGGYYTVSPRAGFRVISLNNNDCYNMNWWLYHDGRNGLAQLEWLHDTLLAAEKAGELVHILAHIPSGDNSCWSVWSREYNRLVERFSHVISGVFNGHSHKDEMNVHYSAGGHAIGISWNGGSLTPFTDKNPNYRLYQVEPATMQVVDHETWIFNLTAANLLGGEHEPEWFKEYTFSEEFTADLSPAGIDALLDEMAANPDLLRKFWTFKMTSADPRLAAGCGRACLMSTICRLATTVSDQTTRCEALKAKLATALDSENTTQSPGSTESSTTDSTDPVETTTQDSGDGAASMSALKITSIVGLFFLLKFFF